jgi:hypothetical protein
MALLRRAHGVRALGLLVGAAVALTPLLVLAARSAPHTGDAGPGTGHPLPEAVSPAGLIERSGIRIEHLAATGGGGLLDLRYQVVDPSTAAALHDPETPPAIVHERTGVVIESLLMDHAHTGQFKAGLTYYLIFNNPGQIVHPGDRVAVVLGNARVEHLRVR